MNGATLALPHEEALIHRATVEPAAFADLYEHYFPRVYNYIRYRVQDAEVADDITARTFERALRGLHSYKEGKGTFSTWLFIIAVNSTNDHFRAERRRRWLSLEALRGRTYPAPGPEEVNVNREMRAELLQAIAQLGDRERNLIALKFGTGLTNRQIAVLTRLSESNVAVILYRTVRHLRTKIGTEE